jgi:hypothetical protein
MPESGNFLTRDFGWDPPDAPAGQGAAGFGNRAWTGFRQGITPNNPAQMALRGTNPMAYLLGGIGEGLKDAIGGSQWFMNLRDRLRGNRPPTPGGLPPNYRQQMGAGPPSLMDDPRYQDAINSGPVDYRYNDAVGAGPPEEGGPRRMVRYVGQTGGGRSGAFRGDVIAQRGGGIQSDRALEGMAEGFLGQSAQSRMRQSGLQARREMERMFGRSER